MNKKTSSNNEDVFLSISGGKGILVSMSYFIKIEEIYPKWKNREITGGTIYRFLTEYSFLKRVKGVSLRFFVYCRCPITKRGATYVSK